MKPCRPLTVITIVIIIAHLVFIPLAFVIPGSDGTVWTIITFSTVGGGFLLLVIGLVWTLILFYLRRAEKLVMKPCLPLIIAAAVIIVANVLPVLWTFVDPGFVTVGWAVYFLTIPASILLLPSGLIWTLIWTSRSEEAA
ncbi:MAG: hypothetical protein AAF485_29115 [Chloroflexota bacterium]